MMSPTPASSLKIEPADVSVIVPVGGAAPHWERSARSLAGLEPAPGEIVAVIDGPDPGHAATAAEAGARVVELEARGGPAKARNRGAREARGEVLLFVDSDVELPPGLVARVAELFSADPELAAVMGSYDDAPGDPHFFSRYRNLLHHFVHQTGREEASTFWAGCGAVRRRVFLALEGFDERYAEPSIEDIELGARLVRSGGRIRLVKTLQVKHLKRWRPGDMLATDLWRRAVPWTRLMLREGRMVNDLNVGTRNRLSVAVAFLPLIVLALAVSPALPAWSLLPAVAAVAAILVALNGAFFRFLWRRLGAWFALGAVPAHWLYLWTCGLGFGLGLLAHLFERGR